MVTATNTITGKRAMPAEPSGLILVVRPGRYSQDVFVVDDPKAALEALTPAKRRKGSREKNDPAGRR